MKVACDVQGTLKGPMQKQVIRLLQLFYKAGYEITVWSHGYGFQEEMTYLFEKHGIVASDYNSKRAKTEYPYENDSSKFFNFAIEDDRNQKYLAAKEFIWVSDIPEEMSQVDLFFREIVEGQ